MLLKMACHDSKKVDNCCTKKLELILNLQQKDRKVKFNDELASMHKDFFLRKLKFTKTFVSLLKIALVDFGINTCNW